MRVPEKVTFKRLSGQLAFGNRLRQWDSMGDLHAAMSGSTLAESERLGPADGFNGWVTVRSNQADSPCFIPSIRATEAFQRFPLDAPVYFQELPHQPGCDGVGCDGCGRLISFEARWLPGAVALKPEPWRQTLAAGLHLKYAHHPSLNLRHDLERNGRELVGQQAMFYLRDWLAEDYEVLEQIWDLYPDAVIEATRFSVPAGVLESRLVIWEVRDY